MKENHVTLTFRWMLKTTVNDGTEQLWLEKEIPEAGAVDGNVGTLHLLLACSGGTFGGSLGLIVIFIVKQLIINVVLSHCVVCLSRKQKPQPCLITLSRGSPL